MKGILLAGGNGTRLYPLTKSVSKHLLPVYDKPMIYYPMQTLERCGITDVLIISSPKHLGSIAELIGDGNELGVNVSYAVQPSPDGIAQALVIGEKFINHEPAALILGDNIFIGDEIEHKAKKAFERAESGRGATVFAAKTDRACEYGVAVMYGDTVERIVEKPIYPLSDLAVTGLYVYDENVCEYAKKLAKSERNEYEITDLNNIYISHGKLFCEVMSESAWFDAGTPDRLLETSNFMRLHKLNKVVI